MNKLRILTISMVAAGSLFAGDALIDAAKNAGLKPIPFDHKAQMKLVKEFQKGVTPAKAELGRKLYFEPRLSKSGLISCNTCHNLGMGGADGVSAAIGHQWTANPHHLNSPTVYNSVFNTTQFWDGRSPHLGDQAKGPMQAMPEMAITPKMAEERISSIPEYVAEFKKAFPQDKNPVTFENIADAIASFEAILVTPSKFDKFLAGNANALNKDEKEGLKLFIDKGCTTCHTGYNVGGGSKQKFPLMGEYKYANIGDFKGDKDGMVKVPTLRNITQTAPYMHNGAIWSLEEAVKTMGELQLGAKLTDAEIAKIVTFLKTLEGKKPSIEYPMLPSSTAKTPKPDAK
ncbi:MAG: cytochrome-c peroxidase [Campylobacteraceae bacterium]|nr:cytochrome-c peroxidase [Campylobacteraceae bacterium]